MKTDKWVDRWMVQSETDPTKFYTVSRAKDGSFGCSCPAWKFRKVETCKHIRGAADTIIGLSETETAVVNRMRFISKMHHIKLSCDNCQLRLTSRSWSKCSFGQRGQKLIFVKGDKKTFYILGKCCIQYKRIKE